jgi:hypothetical protein
MCGWAFRNWDELSVKFEGWAFRNWDELSKKYARVDISSLEEHLVIYAMMGNLSLGRTFGKICNDGYFVTGTNILRNMQVLNFVANNR